MTASDRLYSLALGAISGLMVGVVSGLAHRALLWGLPLGMVGVVVMIVALIVFNRSLGGRLGLAAGLVALIGTLVVFSIAEGDAIVLPDAYGMFLGGTVTLAAVLGLAWPPSHRSRLGDEASANG